jgi:N utilization substance protein B
MPARHRSRQRALQILFLWDQRKQALETALESFYDTLGIEEDSPQSPAPLRIEKDEFMETLVHGTVEHSSAIDQLIRAKSANWRMERMAVVDRNILRLAVYEMTHTKTPRPIVIDEALELARQFSGDESVSFINGVLDAVHREDRASPQIPAQTP